MGSPVASHSPTRPPPGRSRLDSKDIPRTYSGLFGDGNDLLPFELSRNRNTDWIIAAGWWLLVVYVSIVFVSYLVFLAFWPWDQAWTVTNTVHCLITMIYLHWIKGSPNFYEQGEMNAMTLWEQILSTAKTTNAQRALWVIPTLLCYIACHVVQYEPSLSCYNVVVWCFCIVPKLSFMNGVRILGINSTTGIDDEDQSRKDL
mmetsp:Transcript_49411/g.73657  ORF Transcript_49411/g.73657 Transcript_49411/m.73657 type:complete len:202 (-) Transcript_49411:160-765(-)